MCTYKLCHAGDCKGTVHIITQMQDTKVPGALEPVKEPCFDTKKDLVLEVPPKGGFSLLQPVCCQLQPFDMRCVTSCLKPQWKVVCQSPQMRS